MKSDLEKLQEKLLKTANKGDLEGTAKILLKMGGIYQKLNRRDLALESYENAEKLYKKCKNPKGEALSILNIGKIHEIKGKLKKAQKMYEEAGEKFKKINDIKNQATSLYHYARILEKQGKTKDALKKYKEYHKLSTIMDDKTKLLASYAKIKRLKEHSSPKPSRYHWLLLTGYIISFFVAEISTTYVNVPTGLGIHAFILFVLFLHSSLAPNKKFRNLLNSMMILPLIRIISLSMPIMKIPQLYWFIIIAIPLLAASYTLTKIQNLGRKDVGLNLNRPITQFLIALTGIPLGYIEFQILHPKALIPTLTLPYLILGFIVMLIGTGFAEEILFRGIIQKNSEELLGAFIGLIYTALLFAIFHIGWKSIRDLILVLSVAIFYGYIYQRTRSIIGVTFSHGLSNFILFIVIPFFF